MIKKLYHGLSLLAMIVLFAMGGLVTYLFASGRLDHERVNRIGLVLRGEYPATQPSASQPTTQEAHTRRSGEEIAAIQVKHELAQFENDRLKQEMAQRQALGESIELRVLRRLEEIQRRSEAFEKQKKTLEQQGELAGFNQVLEMYSAMEPKLAKDLLKTKEKEADVVHLFSKMDPGPRKKIINTCKTAEEKLWIRRILDQIQTQEIN